MDVDSLTLLERVGYPRQWLMEASRYGPDDAYVRFDPAWAEDIPPIPDATVDVIVQRHASERPTAVAMVYLGRSITYGELHDLVGRAAGVLRDSGIGQGDVVAVMVPTSAIHWVLFFAVARLGATHCGVNVMYQADELGYLLADAKPAALICLDQFLPIVDQVLGAVRPPQLFSVSIRDLADPAFRPYPALAEWWEASVTPTPASSFVAAMAATTSVNEPVTVRDVRTEIGQIVYTAGTTGTPKGVLQSHYNLVHNAVTHTVAMPGVARPVTYSVLPLFHTGGFFVYSLPAFVRGGTVIPRPLFDPADTLHCIQSCSVNVLFGPPTMLSALLAHGVGAADLSSVEICSTGAAPIPDDLPHRWQAATGLHLNGGWGMSELNSLGTFNGLPGKPTPGSLGVPVVGEVRITINGAVAARDTDGDVEFRGMQVSQGYLGKPEETNAAFGADGWFRTGDIGRLDRAGALHYVDRKKDLIVSSGYNISPAEIEKTLLLHPRVSDAAVVGEPHRYRGEVPVAYVVGDVSPGDLSTHLRRRLAVFKIPHRIVVVDRLPKNSMGKTVKRSLLAEEGR